MPSAYNAQQKAMISQFTSFTAVKDSVAAKQLKSHGWNLQQALDAFFSNSNTSSASSGSNVNNALNKIFDTYRDNPSEEPNKILVEGSMRYFEALKVKLDDVVVLAVLTELGAPTMGEFTRQEFIQGWSQHRAETISKQQQQVSGFRRNLGMSPDFFKKVYRRTHFIARPPGQKVVPLETAVEYWRLLFSPPSVSWNTASTPWLEWWIEFVTNKWKKSINKDTWDQTGTFALKTLEDESMSWWVEDGAWPSILDDFVGHVREKRGDGSGEEMDVG